MIDLLNPSIPPGTLAAAAGHPISGPLSLVHSGSSWVADGRHLLFLAEPGAAHPFAVVKWARGPAEVRLLNEIEGLNAVRAAHDPVLNRSCPAVWGPFPASKGGLLSVQTYFPGNPIYSQLRVNVRPRTLVSSHFTGVQAWLARFWPLTGGGVRPLTEEDLNEQVERPLVEARGRLGSDVIPDGALRSALEDGRAYLGLPTRFALEHGDLWPSNLLAGSDGLGVIDWEHFCAVPTLPLFDPLLFCTTYALNFPWRPFGWADPVDAFARTYIKPGWFTLHVAQFLEYCCSANSTPRGLIPIMLLVALARMASRRADDPPTGASQSSTIWVELLRLWSCRPPSNWLDRWAGIPIGRV